MGYVKLYEEFLNESNQQSFSIRDTAEGVASTADLYVYGYILEQ
jgi:hypothetical protein